MNCSQMHSLEQQLARFLDRPFFPWKKVLAGFSLGQFIVEGFLSLRQYRVLQRTKPPKVLENEVSQELFDKSQVWTPLRSSPIQLLLYHADQSQSLGLRSCESEV